MSKKAHGHDNSIWMLKICGTSIGCSLAIIFKNCLNHGKFSKVWKNANLTPKYNKGGKSLVINYIHVSLWPTCRKILQRSIYNSSYSYLIIYMI